MLKCYICNINFNKKYNLIRHNKSNKHLMIEKENNEKIKSTTNNNNNNNNEKKESINNNNNNNNNEKKESINNNNNNNNNEKIESINNNNNNNEKKESINNNDNEKIKSTTNNNNNNNNEKKESINNNIIYKCKICNKTFSTKTWYDKHCINFIHKINENKNIRIPVINTITGNVKYGKNAPLKNKLDNWLNKYPYYKIYNNNNNNNNNNNTNINNKILLLNLKKDLIKITKSI